MSSTHPDFSPDRPLSPAPKTAAEWLARRDRGFTASEAGEFDRWVAADPVHAAAIAELDTAWSALDQLSALRPSGLAALNPDPDLLRPTEKRRRIYWWRPLLLSAGVAAAIAVFFWNGPTQSTPPSIEGMVYETAVGAERTVDLEDGSHLQLNTNSAVEVRFSAEIRQVNLRRGEIFCAVTKDPRRPFVVKANGVSVRAVGTAFDVLQQPERIDILVTEGSVRLSADGQQDQTQARLLEQGNRGVAPVGRPESEFTIAPITSEEAARLLAWRGHQLDFKESSLAEVALEFNRYNPQQLLIANPETGAVVIGGRFSPTNIEGFVRLLESSFGIAAERPNPGTIVLRKIR